MQARDPSGSGATTTTTSEKCISLDSVDNGVPDCGDKSDEFGK